MGDIDSTKVLIGVMTVMWGLFLGLVKYLLADHKKSNDQVVQNVELIAKGFAKHEMTLHGPEGGSGLYAEVRKLCDRMDAHDKYHVTIERDALREHQRIEDNMNRQNRELSDRIMLVERRRVNRQTEHHRRFEDTPHIEG